MQPLPQLESCLRLAFEARDPLHPSGISLSSWFVRAPTRGRRRGELDAALLFPPELGARLGPDAGPAARRGLGAGAGPAVAPLSHRTLGSLRHAGPGRVSAEPAPSRRRERAQAPQAQRRRAPDEGPRARPARAVRFRPRRAGLALDRRIRAPVSPG